jgi:transcriptional regulator with XRE-family HTH domain
VIVLPDPTRIGPALAEIRELQGMSRRQLARAIAAKTGRSETSVNAQLWFWDTGRTEPNLSSIGTLLDILGYRLALDPREEA